MNEAVRALTNGKGVDIALDAVGGDMFEPTLKTLRTAWSALRRVADRLGVGPVVLLSLHKRLDVGRRNQPSPVTERPDLPMISGCMRD
jgi:hypothetical protein